MKLGEASWRDVAAVAAESLLVVPLGATEQHGPHLPLSTDTTIALALAEHAAALRPDLVVAPPLPFGSSGEHAHFTGTLSIGQCAFEAVVVELVRSADDFAGVVLISGHGGNAAPLRRAVARLGREGRRVIAWSPHGGADAHAGHTETSLMMAIDPRWVRHDAVEVGNTCELRSLLPALQRGGVAAVSPNGVLGDPTRASAVDGRAYFAAMVDDLLRAIDRLRAHG